jgi:hypothetical protein
VAAQLSILVAAKADPAAALPNIICTDHGLAELPSDQAPTDLPQSCALCPFCLTMGAGQIAVLPPTGFSVIDAPADRIVFHLTADRGDFKYFTQPRSRGPPTFA